MAAKALFMIFLWIAHDANCATVRSFPKYDYGKFYFHNLLSQFW